VFDKDYTLTNLRNNCRFSYKNPAHLTSPRTSSYPYPLLFLEHTYAALEWVAVTPPKPQELWFGGYAGGELLHQKTPFLCMRGIFHLFIMNCHKDHRQLTLLN
jgi:hypothetical protein